MQRYSLLIIALTASFFCSCSANEPTVPASSAKPSSARARAGIGPDETVSAGEYHDAAVAIETATRNGDATALGEFFDLDSLFNRATRKLDLKPGFKTGFMEGFRGTGPDNKLATQIIAETENGGTYDLLRVHVKAGQHYALFRFKSSQGLNYHDLLLAKNDQGEVRVMDFYVMMTGEMMSETLRRIILPLAAEQNRSMLDKMLQSESEFVKDFPKLRAMQSALKSSNGKEAIRVFHTMSPSMQKEKMVLLIRMMAAAQVEDWAENEAAVEDYKKHYPDDLAIDLLSVDALLTSKKFDEAQAAVDRIDKSVGGDPYLDVFRANIHLEAGDAAMARQHLEKALSNPKADSDVYFQMVGFALVQKDHALTLEYLRKLEDRFDIEYNDLTTLPEYAEFVKSPEYQEFLKRQK